MTGRSFFIRTQRRPARLARTAFAIAVRVTIATLLMAAGASVSLNAESVKVTAPSSVVLGDAITVSVEPLAGIDSVKVELVNAGGVAVGASEGFPLKKDGHLAAWVVLLGIPTTIAPGSYRIQTRIETGQGVTREELPLTVDTRAFRHENIDLNQNLSTLQTEDTATKVRQAQELWRILTTFDPTAVYQTGPLVMPVEKYFVSSPFGERRLFVFAGGGSQPSIHQGIDLGVDAGTPIRASGAGKVMYAGSMIMTGNTAVIEQLPGVFGLYFHMERLLVHVGQVVAQGDTIGYAGSTGLATGPHLHWQVEVDGVAVNPMSLLTTGLVDLSAVGASAR